MDNQKENFKILFRKRLIKFSVDALALCDILREDRRFWTIVDQLSRSATSIGANVHEAKGASSITDYKRYFEIALKSANETDYWLMVIVEYQPNKTNAVAALQSELGEIVKILNSAILTMKGKKKINNS